MGFGQAAHEQVVCSQYNNRCKKGKRSTWRQKTYS